MKLKKLYMIVGLLFTAQTVVCGPLLSMITRRTTLVVASSAAVTDSLATLPLPVSCLIAANLTHGYIRARAKERIRRMDALVPNDHQTLEHHAQLHKDRFGQYEVMSLHRKAWNFFVDPTFEQPSALDAQRASYFQEMLKKRTFS